MPRTALTCTSAVLVVASLTACSSPEPGPVDPSRSIMTRVDAGDYVPGEVILRDLGTGPVERRVSIPRGYDAVMFSVSCVPDADYEVTFGGSFAADCNRTSSGGATMPLAVVKDATTATLKIPTGTRRWFVAVAMQSQD